MTEISAATTATTTAMAGTTGMTAKTAADCLRVHVEMRDEKWEREFLQTLAGLTVHVLVAQPQEGPDHWPYLLVSSETPNADDNIRNVVDWLSQKGVGLVLNPQKPAPDYVLSYGMIWNFRERGEFLTHSDSNSSANSNPGSTLGSPSKTKPNTGGDFIIKSGQKLWTGAPSEAYLPSYVRSIIKQFFADQGVYTPKVLMVNFQSSEAEQPPGSFEGYDLCFSIESLKSPPAHEHSNIAEALSWFLPAHYSVSLVSEKTVPGFVSL